MNYLASKSGRWYWNLIRFVCIRVRSPCVSVSYLYSLIQCCSEADLSANLCGGSPAPDRRDWTFIFFFSPYFPYWEYLSTIS